MNKAQLVFKAIDGICYPTQNALRFKDVSCKQDISYSEFEETKLDFYYRNDILNDGKKHPLVIYFHGGGFIMGDKKCRISISEYYANQGYFVCCVNYRMAPKVTLTEYITDCINAVNYVNDLALEYPIDKDNIFITGDSSGGYTASYLCALRYNEDLHEILEVPAVEVDFKGALLMCGIYDLQVLLQGTTLMGVIPKTAQTLLHDFDLKKDLSNFSEYKYYNQLSPSAYVNEKWCSTFICWADDDIVCQGQGEPMAEKLKAVVPYFDSYNVGGFTNNHCFHLEFSHNKYAKECMQKSLDFISKVVSMESVEK